MLSKDVFQSLIKASPMLHILIVLDGHNFSYLEDISSRLDEFNGSYDLVLLQNREISNNRIIDETSVFGNKNGKNRKYEMIIYCAMPPNLEYSKKIYHLLENSGVYVLISDKSEISIQDEKEKLESINFVAINEIEFDTEILINAKKMHGWGGGF